MITYDRYQDLFKEFSPQYADRVYQDDWVSLENSVQAGVPITSAIKVPGGGESDFSIVPLEALYVFLEIVNEVIKIIKQFRKEKKDDPDSATLEAELSKRNIPSKALETCRQKGLLKKIVSKIE